MKRRKGKCPSCGRKVAIKIGSGPHADGRGDVMEHRNRSNDILAPGAWCPGGQAIELNDVKE